MITFYKARKSIEADVCTNERIYSQDSEFQLIECYAAKLMKHIKNIGISQKLKIFLLERFKLFPIFNCVTYASD